MLLTVLHLKRIVFANLNKHMRHAFTYGVVGVVAMGVDFCLLYLLTEQFHIFYLYSLVWAYLISALVNYTLQKRITFKCKNNNYFTQFLQFFIVGLVGMGINLIVIYIGTEIFGFWYFYGKIIATFLAFLWNFTANKWFTFRPLPL